MTCLAIFAMHVEVLTSADSHCSPTVKSGDGHVWPNERIWLNSSYELEHGLDVVELNSDVHIDTEQRGRKPLGNVEAGRPRAHCVQLLPHSCRPHLPRQR